MHPSLSTVSYSRLSAFDTCARQFWHQYVDKTPPDGYDRIEGWMGSLVHRTLEWALRETLAKRIPDPVAVVDHYDASWDADFDPARVLVTKTDYEADHYRRVGRDCLKSHLDAEWPFLKHEPLMVEERVDFTLPIGSQKARFMGFVDRVDRADDGRLRVVDYKTGGWLPDFNDASEARQLALYWYALRTRFPKQTKATLVWEYLQHQKTVRVDATPEVVKPAVAWAQNRIRDIQRQLVTDDSKDAFPTSPGPLCRWCSFGYVCADNPYKETAPKPPRQSANASLLDFTTADDEAA